MDTTDETVLQIAAKELKNQPQFDDDDLNDPKKLALLAAASMLNVQLGSNAIPSNSEWITPSVTDNRKKTLIKADRIPRYSEGNALVRLRTDIVWEAIEHWEWRDVTYLAAIAKS